MKASKLATAKTPVGTAKVIRYHNRPEGVVFELDCPRGCGSCLWNLGEIKDGGRWKCPYCRKQNPLFADEEKLEKIRNEAKMVGKEEMRNKKKRSDIHNATTWNKLRYLVLKRDGGRCCLCGRSAADGVKLHVDHIKPVSLYPELYYDPDNLQTLCEECNLGKSDLDDTDWR